MTTAELIALLQTCDPDEPVQFQMLDGCCGDTIDLDLEGGDTMDYASTKETRAGITHRRLSLTFFQLPGYRSCIQSGGTVAKDKEYWARFKKG